MSKIWSCVWIKSCKTIISVQKVKLCVESLGYPPYDPHTTQFFAHLGVQTFSWTG